jgi:DNA-binding MarR family transcriptional regulator
MQHRDFVLEESIAFLLSQAARAAGRELQARLLPHGVTPAQFCVLSCLWEEDGLTASVLAARAGFDGPTLTGILDRLERQELEERRRNPTDRRVTTAHLSERGWALREALPEIAAANEAVSLAGLNDEEVARLRQALRQVLSNLGG